MRCDVVAEGVIESAKALGIGVPLVVRLEGTNVEKGKEILDNSGLSILSAPPILTRPPGRRSPRCEGGRDGHTCR